MKGSLKTSLGPIRLTACIRHSIRKKISYRETIGSEKIKMAEEGESIKIFDKNYFLK